MSPTTVSVFAPAKINLTLHITGQRLDGYHLIDSLVAFATVGDELRVSAAKSMSLTVKGPESEGVPDGAENLALRAVALVDPGAKTALTLRKNLPPASGIGGGSADAAAAFRGMRSYMSEATQFERLHAPPGLLPNPESDRILALGADIPMCLTSHPARIRGIGDFVEHLDLPQLPAILVNPRVALPTPAVFRELEMKVNSPMPDVLPEFRDAGALVVWLSGQRNDLEAPAIRIAPAIIEVLRALQETEHCGLARMSGSGATCFGLYSDPDAARAAARQLRRLHPNWWVEACMLGDQSDAARPRIN